MRSSADDSQYSLPGLGNSSIDDVSGIDLLTLTPERLEHLKKRRPSLLGLTCGRSDCENGLHSFRPKRAITQNIGIEPCNQCGFEMVPTGTILPRDLAAFESSILLLDCEWIRHFFLHVPITPRIEQFALRLGKQGVLEKAADHLNQKKMLNYMPALDYNQTKMLDGTIIHWARHAMACCCRRCMAYWHGVPMSATLSGEDTSYFQKLIARYVAHKLPSLDVSAASETRPTASRGPLLKKAS